MAKLSLRVDVVDNTDAAGPNAVAYSVIGFTCGTSAMVRANPGRRDSWILHRMQRDQAWERVGEFTTPAEVVSFLEAWCSMMELKAVESRPQREA